MKNLLVCLICTLLCSQVLAEQNGNFLLDCTKTKSVSVSTVYRSQYVLSSGVVCKDEGVVQADLFVQMKSGLTLDLWASAPIDVSDFNKDFGTELDGTVGYTNKFGDYCTSFGLSFYDMKKVGTLSGSDLFCAYLEVSRDFLVRPDITITPYLRLELDFTTDGTVGSDLLPQLGSRVAWHANDRLTVVGKGYLLYDPGMFGADTALIGGVEGKLCWKLAEHVSLELPYLRVVAPLTDVSDNRDTEFVWGIGLTFSF